MDENDRPLSRAEIHLVGEDFFASGWTDETGRVALAVDRPRAVGVLKFGYQPKIKVLDVSARAFSQRTIVLKKSLAIRGRLVSGISGARFSWWGWTVRARVRLETSSMGEEVQPFLLTLSLGPFYERLQFMKVPV